MERDDLPAKKYQGINSVQQRLKKNLTENESAQENSYIEEVDFEPIDSGLYKSER